MRPIGARRFWRGAGWWALGWAVASIVLAMMMMQIADARGVSLPVLEAIVPSAVYAVTWVALLPLLVGVARRLPFDAKGTWWRIPLAAIFRPALAVVATSLQLSLYFLLMQAFSSPTLAATPWEENGGVFFLGRLYEGITLSVVALIVDALWTRSRAEHARQLHEARIGAQLTEARLSALSMELQPHFLFNTLNAISTLVHRDQDAADRMIARLSTLLRKTLEAGRQPVASLHEEIALLELYLDIQRVRFGARLSVSMEVAEDVREALIPRLLLQPLVENAMHHGLARKPGPVSLSLQAQCVRGVVEIFIDDSGEGLPDVVVEGTGLRNTRARLTTLYADRFALQLARRVNGGTRVRLEIPYVEQ